MKINPACAQAVVLPLRFLILVLAFSVTAANGIDPAVSKLFGKWTTSPSNYFLGGVSPFASHFGGPQVAATDKWIIAGAPESYEGGSAAQGAVQVFSATTGAWVRKLLPPTSAGNQGFGISCAISGDLAVIGAPDFPGSTPGAAYVYNLTTGALVRTLLPAADGANGDQFGSAIAVLGSTALIGSLGDDSIKGSAYLFNINTGAKLFKLTDASGIAGDGFGYSVAVEGNIGVVAAPFTAGSKGVFCAFDLSTGNLLLRSSAAAVANDKAGFSVAISGGVVVLGAPYANSNAGKVYTYHLLSGQQRTFAASDGAAGDYFGFSVSAQGGMILVGSPVRTTFIGASYLLDLNGTATTELRKLAPPDEKVGLHGMSVALSGNTAIISAAADLTQTGAAGAILVYKPLTGTMPLTKITAKGDYAPGAVDIKFNAFSDVYLNEEGEMVFTSTLTGAGSNSNKDTGVWDTLGTTKTLDLGTKSRLTDGALTFTSVSKALCNQSANAYFQAVLSGVGVTAANNLAIYKDTGSTVSQVMRTGTIVTEFPAVAPAVAGAAPAKLLSVSHSRRATNIIGVACSLQLGINGTSAANDSGIILRNESTSVNQTEREGALAGSSGLTFGQFTGRLAFFDLRAAYTAAVQGVAASNQAVFATDVGSGAFLVRQKGSSMVGTDGGSVAGVSYSSFIGESVADDTVVLYRATVAGTGVTAANNEGLWSYSAGTTRQILRKGIDLSVATVGYVPPSGLVGVKVAKFLAFWEAYNQQMALVQLSGTGVTAANDQALVLFQTIGAVNNLLVLMREGQPAPGCPGASIGVISRVEVEPYYGQYLVLATLTGATKGTEQALFRGASRLSVNATNQKLRCPHLILRKGQLFDNQPSKVLSIALPKGNLTASGAGTTGLGRAMQETTSSSDLANIAVLVTFANGVQQVMKGVP